jgi:predicted RNase H-like HicB family nuclease
LTIKLDRETDGRWIAEVPEPNVLIYGAGRDEAIRKAESAAMEITAGRIQRGTLPPDAANPVFAIGA